MLRSVLFANPFKSIRPKFAHFYSAQSFTTRIYVKAIPKKWDTNEISARFGIVGQVDDVYFVKSEQGTSTESVVITYKTE